MSDKISDERLIEWRESIQWLNSPIRALREFAEFQASAIDELLARRAAEAKLQLGQEVPACKDEGFGIICDPGGKPV